ncbi:MAG: Multidrug resistance protein MexB [candidate division WS6 bacterium OLB20]|uniref:Multidrug resistance protein MexB n=1 Tax=candidate division WS6 bacterium OLB20 TaxID=1617426 RepID=A0A136M076_9BACT|nr:MAG: Multidrug resistance protein MexB [candidate division WS6 bacterium OLB20]
MIGLTGLMGIVVNNTIMLLDFANQERAEGKGIIDAAADAVKIRFRPLVTTSFTTVAGLLPLALTDPFWEPLAFTIIFGLVSSTLMVIIAFPAFYAAVETVRNGRRYLQQRIAKVFVS